MPPIRFSPPRTPRRALRARLRVSLPLSVRPCPFPRIPRNSPFPAILNHAPRVFLPFVAHLHFANPPAQFFPDVVRTWSGRGWDGFGTWLGRGLDVVGTWLGRGLDGVSSHRLAIPRSQTNRNQSPQSHLRSLPNRRHSPAKRFSAATNHRLGNPGNSGNPPLSRCLLHPPHVSLFTFHVSPFTFHASPLRGILPGHFVRPGFLERISPWPMTSIVQIGASDAELKTAARNLADSSIGDFDFRLGSE